MDLTHIKPRDRQHIQKYGAQGFTVSGVVFQSPVLVFANQTLAWNVLHPSEITPGTFAPLLERAATLDLCLLGSGSKTHQIPTPIKEALKKEGINIEAMDTGAACRTFNVLLSEGRALAAALFPTAI